MSSMTNPHDGLVSFQRALDDGDINLHRCVTDNELYVYVDTPSPEVLRYTYTRLLPNHISSGISIVVMAEPYEGLPCFQVGYAVPIEYRGQGNATDVLTASIKELRAGLSRNGVNSPIYIEALIDKTNTDSIRVAEKVLGPYVKEAIDKFTGTPAYQFVLKVDP